MTPIYVMPYLHPGIFSVFQKLAEGYTLKEVARELVLAYPTVRNQAARGRQIYGAKTNIQLVLMLRESGLV